MDHKGEDVMDWFDLAQDRHRWRQSCKSGNGLSGSTECRGFLD
jgi:hypothetical protein